MGSVLSRWEELVGPSIAAHASPESYENSEVTVRCDSTNYATYLRTMQGQLLSTFERELGPGIVTRVTVRGRRALLAEGPSSGPGWSGPAGHLRLSARCRPRTPVTGDPPARRGQDDSAAFCAR
ncbi:hypothetical protein A5N15_03950 [Rothia kristinae]|uniref:DUF721 domain-containing protein n=1 Tax=Rothia kristinae TaxID=37923 RepID=A0A657IVN7_9MICC|nr:hypothetical protein A5N15_03950 [Rothia kristinae]